MPKPNAVKVFSDDKRYAVVTCCARKSTNVKTGDMAQVFIQAIGERPTDATKSGLQVNACGDCPLNGTVCYVGRDKSSNAVYKAYHDREVEPVPESINKPVRIGSDGDGAFIPAPIRQQLIDAADGHTMYTHQWEFSMDPDLPKHAMASVDHLMAKRAGVSISTLRRRAKRKGYRTFRVLKEGEKLHKDEVPCPAVHPDKATCAKCLLCGGTCGKNGKLINAKSIAIPVHGSGVAKY